MALWKCLARKVWRSHIIVLEEFTSRTLAMEEAQYVPTTLLKCLIGSIEPLLAEFAVGSALLHRILRVKVVSQHARQIL